MLQFRNRTPFAGTIFASPDPEGIDSLYVIIKGTFDVGSNVSVAEQQLDVVPAAAHYGDPTKTSIRVPSDVCLIKPGTDVLLMGSAWAPDGHPTWQMDISLSVGSVRKVARVSGDRVWESGPTGMTTSWVARFERMPLTWERAYGGADETDKGPVAHPANPVGVGFRAPGSQRPLAGLPLPNVEDPLGLISSVKDAPMPAGFAPIAAHWTPRVTFAGTYDEGWQRKRAPFLPMDFDPRFFQIAPPGLMTTGYLQGGEPVEARGVTPSGTLTFRLPRQRIRVTYVLDSGSEVRWANLDTVLLEPDAARLAIVWRTGLTCDKKLMRIREIGADAYAGT